MRVNLKKLSFLASTACLLTLNLFAFPVKAETTEPSKDFSLATGERISLPSKGFSLVPPIGWEVHTNYAGLSLLLQVPFTSDLPYQRTIQVMSFKGVQYIDHTTGEEFEKIIEERYARALPSVRNYRIRDHLLTKMSNGSEGILFYSEFELNEKSMMQAHILVSSATHHYLLTYTDIAQHFQGEEADQYLSQAWNAMTSIELDQPAPARYSTPVLMGGAILILVLIVGFLLIVRRKRAARAYGAMLHGESGDDDMADLEELEEYGDELDDQDELEDQADPEISWGRNKRF